MLKWPSQNTTTTTLIHKASVGNISFTLTMRKLSLSWFISSPSLSSHEFFTHLWSFLFIKCPPSMAWTSFYQYETCWWCFPCSHCWPMSLSNHAPGSTNTVLVSHESWIFWEHNIGCSSRRFWEGSQFDQASRAWILEKGCKAHIDAVLLNLKHCYESHWPCYA